MRTDESMLSKRPVFKITVAYFLQLVSSLFQDCEQNFAVSSVQQQKSRYYCIFTLVGDLVLAYKTRLVFGQVIIKT